MGDITVSNSIDTFMQSVDQAEMRTRLALGDAATKNTGTAAGTVAAGDDSRITGALQTSGGTMTGKLTAAADNTIAKLSVGSRTAGSSPTTLSDGDIWISNQGALSYRDSTGPASRAVAATSLSNTFNQPQTIGVGAGTALTVTNSGTGTSASISNTVTATSDAVVITNLGSGNSLVVNDETTPDSTRFAIANNGKVGIGVTPDTSVALSVDTTGIKFGDGTIQTTAGGGGGGGGTVTSVTAGAGLTGGTITGSGTIAADFGATTGKVTEGGTTVLKAGDTMTGKLTLPAATTASAPLNLGSSGVQPTSPAVGDVWIRNNLIQYRGSSITVNSVAATAEPNTFGARQTIQATDTLPALRVTQLGTGEALRVEDEANPDTTAFVVANNGRVGIGVTPDASVALSVDTSGIKFGDNTTQTTAFTGTASNVTGTVAIANGGTGQTDRQAAMDALAGATTSGQYLRGNGTDVVMSAIQAADVPTLNQNTTGTAANVTGTVAIANGGTGQTTPNAAVNALLPSQSGNSGKVLSTDGTNTQWITSGGAGTVTSVGVSGGTTGLTTSGGPVTGSGTITIAGTLALANGGTGATTQPGAANAVLPSQASNSGKFLTTDGSNVSWATAGGGAATPVDRQMFLASGTWTKPAGAKLVVMRAATSGGAGGPGSRTVPGRIVYGGTGAASGGQSEITYAASAVPSSLNISITNSGASVGYPSFFANSIDATAGTSSLPTVSAKSQNKFFIQSPASGGLTGGNPSFLNNAVAVSAAAGFSSNAGALQGSQTTATALGSSGGCGGQNSTATSTASASSLLIGSMFSPAATPATTQFATGQTGTMSTWVGTFTGNGSSGGSGGANALNTALGGSGGNGGGWATPVTLTNVATTSNSTTVTCASTTGLQVNMSIPDIVAFSPGSQPILVASIVNSTTFTLNFAAASTASGLTVVASAGVGGGGGGGGCTQAGTPILITGVNLTSGDTTVTCASTRGILPGMTIISNANIPASTTVATLVSETQFTISAAATGNETGGKLVVAGSGTITGLTVTSGSGNVTATSTLGLSWGQAICTTTSSTGTHLNPSSAATRFNHVAAVTSGTAFVVSGTANSTGNALSATVINTVGFLSGVSVTASSPIITVSDTTPLYVGMMVCVGVRGDWTTTASTGATLASSFLTSGSRFLGDGVIEGCSAAASSGTTVTFNSPSNVVASVTGKYFSTRITAGNPVFPESSTGYPYARIVSIDSPTQITVDINSFYTDTGLSLMYAFTGGHGGRGSSGALEIITYF